MEQKEFNIVADKVGEALSEMGISKAAKQPREESGTAVLFTGEDIAYSILYEDDKKRFNLRTCDVDDGVPDDKWKSVSMWLYDPETDTPAQAQSIADDFIETVQGPKQVAIVKAKKKKKKDDDNNIDPLFFFNRFVGIFPDLKAEITAEKASYGDVRAVTFARSHLLPKIADLCLRPGSDDLIGRCCTLFNDMYINGDLDVRSIITIVLLNGLNKEAIEKMEPLFNDELKKACKSGLKMKGKKVKPEKRKKRKSFMAQALDNTNAGK